MTAAGANGNANRAQEVGDKIDLSRAGAAATRWRRAAAEAMGGDPGAPLDRPDRRLLMLRVFGAARRLGELCMTHPAAAASALIDGPSPVLAQAARDLSALERGVGGPDALHAALAPLKNRADMAVALAELGGQWSVSEATSARVDFAERLVETGLQWLVRAAVKRGELTVEDADHLMRGVFVVAGGDFAHEDLAPYGPLDLILLYDEQQFAGPAARGADRVFVRIGAELREAFEGKPGEYPLFSMRTPLGSGVGGAGYADSAARVRKAAEAPQAQALKMWLATARIVAGDRTAGGAFLESVESIVWGETALLTDDLRDKFEQDGADPRTVFRRIADLCRLAVGGARPVFRTASGSEIFETATRSRALTCEAARRLIAGEELAHIVVSRAQMMKGSAASEVEREDEKRALAILCGYSEYEMLAAALNGAQADGRNILRNLMRGPQEELALYRSSEEGGEDADRLEDLGFADGAGLSAVVDSWAQSAGNPEKRFSAVAPGLLTEFGETQHPNQATRLFDSFMSNIDDERDVSPLISDGASHRNILVDALGCFGAATAPLTESAEGVDAFFDPQGAETPQTGAEWLNRFMPPRGSDGASLEDIAEWRRQIMARITLGAVSGATSFDTAVEAIGDVHIRALTELFDVAKKAAPKEEKTASAKIALHVFDCAGDHMPGSASHLGFIAKDSVGDAGEAFARRYINLLSDIGEGVFAIAPDTSHRPMGVAGPLAPDATTFKEYVQSEAVAHDLMMLARGRVIAGAPTAAEAARDALRSAVSGGRRADILFRDLDRARAQRMRRERPTSEWDIERLEGGRLDVELVISTLIYKHAPAHPFVQETSTYEALDAMARSELISEETAQGLKSARAFWARLALIRALAGWSDPLQAPVRARFGKLIAKAAGVEKFDQVRPLMRGYSDHVSRLYAHIVLGRPPLSAGAQAAG